MTTLRCPRQPAAARRPRRGGYIAAGLFLLMLALFILLGWPIAKRLLTARVSDDDDRPPARAPAVASAPATPAAGPGSARGR